MATDVKVPTLGESITEGTLAQWLKKPGERVERDEPLFEISTDKVDTEIPSPGAGTLQEVLVQEGNTVAINTIVARIADDGGGAAPQPETATAAAQTSAPEGTTPQAVETAGLGQAEQLASYTLTDQETWAHPALAGRQLLVKGADSLSSWALP